MPGRPNFKAMSSGVKAAAAGRDRVVEHRHLDHHALQALGSHRGDLERDVGSQRGAADDRPLELQVIEQGHGLAGEGGHRVVPHLHGPVRGPVAERIERDDAVAPPGQLAGQRGLHLLREQQTGQEDGGAITLSVGRV